MTKPAKAARVEKAGVIRDQGYQPYTGSYTPQGGRWALIAGRMLKLTLPQWWVILIIVAAALRLLVGGAALWIKWKLTGAMPSAADLPPGMTLPTVANPDESVLAILVDASGTLLLAFILALFAGGSAIADDARVGAFQFYFARAVTKMQYLVGKLVPLLVLVGAVVIVPTMLLAVLRISLAPTGAEALHKLPLLFAALGGGIVTTLTLSLPALALSATSSRRGYVHGAYATLFVLPWVVGGILSRLTRSAWPSLLSLPAHLENVSRFFFRMRVADAPTLPVWVSAVVLAAVIVGSFVELRRRLDNIEVVQGS